MATRRRRDEEAYAALRRAAAVVMLALVVFLVLADVIGRLVFSGSFEVRDTTIGTILGTLILVLGIRTIRNGGPTMSPGPLGPWDQGGSDDGGAYGNGPGPYGYGASAPRVPEPYLPPAGTPTMPPEGTQGEDGGVG